MPARAATRERAALSMLRVCVADGARCSAAPLRAQAFMSSAAAASVYARAAALRRYAAEAPASAPTISVSASFFTR